MQKLILTLGSRIFRVSSCWYPCIGWTPRRVWHVFARWQANLFGKRHKISENRFPELVACECPFKVLLGEILVASITGVFGNLCHFFNFKVSICFYLAFCWASIRQDEPTRCALSWEPSRTVRWKWCPRDILQTEMRPYFRHISAFDIHNLH